MPQAPKRVLLEKHLKERRVDRDLSRLIMLIAENTKKVQKAFLTHTSVSNTHNIHGERQLEIDKYSDLVFLKAMEKSRLVKSFASEEQDEIVEIRKAQGSFGVTLDPLDGSSLISANLAVGTIAGFFNEGDVMEKGSKMDAAVLVLYGPLTSLIYTAKNGVHQFVLNGKGKFQLARENIMIPEGKTYAMGGVRSEWLPQHLKFVEALESQGFKTRFSGSFAADVQQILLNGGIFSYPASVKKPEGKLRLIFEGNPMALIAEQAGGAGTNGIEALHSIKPQNLNHRTPIYIGGKKEVELAKSFLKA